VDPAHQRRCSGARPDLLPLHRRPRQAGIEIDRKILADLAVREPEAFEALVRQAAAAVGEPA
jgi:hypothetical protein